LFDYYKLPLVDLFGDWGLKFLDDESDFTMGTMVLFLSFGDPVDVSWLPSLLLFSSDYLEGVVDFMIIKILLNNAFFDF
jgi:hypothetical protein